MVCIPPPTQAIKVDFLFSEKMYVARLRTESGYNPQTHAP